MELPESAFGFVSLSLVLDHISPVPLGFYLQNVYELDFEQLA